VGGAALLLLAQLAYIPNAIVWAISYTLGPGFAFGTGTFVAPTGSALGPVPLFPMLAAIPSDARPGGPAWVPVLVLALPYLAGAVAGIVTVRIAPTPVIEAAPLWGFAAGTATGALAGLGAAFAGGPLGDGRLASVGPSGFQVGLVAVLEIGITAALAAAAANWLILRRAQKRYREAAQERSEAQSDLAPGAQLIAESHLAPGPHLIPGAHLPQGPQLPSESPVPPGQHDEADDVSGHRIYLNPWAANHDDDWDDDDEEISLGVIEEYPEYPEEP
jgi:hypothetical protein